jgi:hypothetical protein
MSPTASTRLCVVRISSKRNGASASDDRHTNGVVQCAQEQFCIVAQANGGGKRAEIGKESRVVLGAVKPGQPKPCTPNGDRADSLYCLLNGAVNAGERWFQTNGSVIGTACDAATAFLTIAIDKNRERFAATAVYAQIILL